MPNRIDNYEFSRLTSGEMAKLLGVAKNTLFHWEEGGKISQTPRDRRMRRLYLPKHIREVLLIMQLRVKASNSLDAGFNRWLTPVSETDEIKTTTPTGHRIELDAIDKFATGKNPKQFEFKPRLQYNSVMSPEKITIIEMAGDGKTTTIIESTKPAGITIKPALAAKILGTTRTTLFRHDADAREIDRQPSKKGARGTGERIYSDENLLRIALKTRRTKIKRGADGKIILSTNQTETVLNIPYEDLGNYL